MDDRPVYVPEDAIKDSNIKHLSPLWKEAYQAQYPTFSGKDEHFISRIHDQRFQFNGVDRTILIPDGANGFKHLHHEEKLDEQCHPSSGLASGNAALEFISNDVSGSVGWVEKETSADVLVYLVTMEKVRFSGTIGCYFFDMRRLQRIWRENRGEWKTNFGIRRIFNKPTRGRPYYTHIVPVPLTVLALHSVRVPIGVSPGYSYFGPPYDDNTGLYHNDGGDR